MGPPPSAQAPEPEAAPGASALPFLSIEDAAGLLRTRRLSPVELTRAVLARIDRLNPAARAYITVTADWALDLAAGHVPAAHAPVVERLLAAGAVLVGKHNLHEFAYGFSNINPHYGTPRNPWDPDRLPGGSSGGTAVALAEGLCLGGLGSDTAGSIRVPSAFCGVTGLKPTYGRVSLRGVLPLSWSLDHVGPMARSAADCALLLDAVAGYDPADPASVDVPAAGTVPLPAGASGLRLGVLADFLEDPHLDPEVRALVDRAIEGLARLGADLGEARLPDLDRVRAACGTIIGAEAAAVHAEWLEDRAGAYGAPVLEGLRRGAEGKAVPLADAYRTRATAVRDADLLLAGFDALVGPTTPHAAPQGPVPHWGRFTSPFDVNGLPALSVPCGFTAEGLPVGLMLIGRRWGERTVLRLGAAYQRTTDWHLRRPPPIRSAEDDTH
jgi:aspartyl-tRNA(Asn)/glutamyl-tRNA(Gln) amidotransferase subunit A